MRYQFTVTFTRELEDDLEAARSRYPEEKDETMLLVKQLRDELQEGYDECCIAGHFHINKDSFKKLED